MDSFFTDIVFKATYWVDFNPDILGIWSSGSMPIVWLQALLLQTFLSGSARVYVCCVASIQS
jgi:hypothetical protein